jgi:hypothetical protein
MRYSLRTLMMLTAIGPPWLALWWFITHSIIAMMGWALFMSFFYFWYWMLLRSQTMDARN